MAMSGRAPVNRITETLVHFGLDVKGKRHFSSFFARHPGASAGNGVA
jgi:hypothetical protein